MHGDGSPAAGDIGRQGPVAGTSASAGAASGYRRFLCLACAMNAPVTASSLRDRLLAGEIVYGAWASIPGAISVGFLAAAGLDYVVVDLQHGAAGETDLPEMTAAIRLAEIGRAHV